MRALEEFLQRLMLDNGNRTRGLEEINRLDTDGDDKEIKDVQY
jgi:hypothetical protein